MLEGSAVRAQLVSRHRLRREALLAEQLAHELDGCAFIPSTLNQDFENLALMIDRAPQVHLLAGDPDDHLVEMPAIARPRTAAPANPNSPVDDPRPSRAGKFAVDSALEEGVSSELVSEAANSLLSSELTGSFLRSGLSG